MSMPRAVFFDWDGTLVDSYNFLLKAHNYAQRSLGIPECGPEDFMAYFGRPREVLYRDMYGDKGADAKVHFEAYVRENHVKDLKPMKGAEDVLKTLKAQDIPMGLVSNKKGEFIRAECAAFGWDHYFASIVGAAEASADKPSGAPLLLAIEKANIQAEPASIWFVGDTETDLACAQEVGCPCIFIETPHHIEEYSGKYGPLFTARDCHAFNEFLLQKVGN